MFMPPTKELRDLYDALTAHHMLRRKATLNQLKSSVFPTTADEVAAFAWVETWIDDKCPAMTPAARAAFAQSPVPYQHCLIATATEVSGENENSPTETILLMWGMVATEPEPAFVTADNLIVFAVDFLRVTTYPAPRLAAEIAMKQQRREYYQRNFTRPQFTRPQA